MRSLTDMEKLSDDELRGKTEEFKARYQKGESIDDLLPEAFAVVRKEQSVYLAVSISCSVNGGYFPS